MLADPMKTVELSMRAILRCMSPLVFTIWGWREEGRDFVPPFLS